MKRISKQPKLGVITAEGNETKYQYGNVFRIEGNNSYKRLFIGPKENHIQLLLKLAELLNPPYYILYVLLISRSGKDCGRYQSPLFESIQELEAFLSKYEDYLESDGRHHLWIGTLDSDLLVYDQHNIIYAYGDITNFVRVLQEEGLHEDEFYFPDNHCHHYYPENDAFEESVIGEFDWQLFPLAEDDEYN